MSEHESQELGYFQSIKRFRPNARLFLVSMSISQLSMAAFTIILNIYLRNLGYSKSFLGVFTTVNLLCSGLVSLPAGFFADRFGRRRSLLIAIVLATIAGLGQVFFTTSGAVLLVFSALRGASNTFKSIVQSPLLVENSAPSERMHLFSVTSAIMHLAGFAGNNIGGLLPMFILEALNITQNIEVAPLRISLIISALFWLVSAIPVLLMKEAAKVEIKGRSKTDFAVVLKNPVARNLAIHNMFIGSGAGLVVPFFNVFLIEQLHASTAQIGFITGGTNLVLIAAVLITPFLVRKLGKVHSVVFTQGLSIPLLIVMALSRSIWVVTLAYWFRNALMNMSSPVTGSFAMEIVPSEQRATTASLMSMTNNLTRAVSATVGGLMMDHIGNGSPYFGTAVIYTIAVLFYFKSFASVEERYDHGLRTGTITAD
ncbi:MAG: major facilitator superfamily permease [Bacillota bacterium]|nr:MAG: major facilitator superfamily permease [Bacillota bacterium]MBS3950544.1 MFS transporter [Peptococcaceae bacterium]